MSRHHPRITAWRSTSELLEVRNALFDNLDQRPWALAKVRAWTTRSRIPHAIEATSMLVDAVVHDIPNASQLHVRLAYSTAICRYHSSLPPSHRIQY
jgi:ribosomal biogenesis protein LAS1